MDITFQQMARMRIMRLGSVLLGLAGLIGTWVILGRLLDRGGIIEPLAAVSMEVGTEEERESLLKQWEHFEISVRASIMSAYEDPRYVWAGAFGERIGDASDLDRVAEALALEIRSAWALTMAVDGLFSAIDSMVFTPNPKYRTLLKSIVGARMAGGRPDGGGTDEPHVEKLAKVRQRIYDSFPAADMSELRRAVEQCGLAPWGAGAASAPATSRLLAILAAQTKAIAAGSDEAMWEEGLWNVGETLFALRVAMFVETLAIADLPWQKSVDGGDLERIRRAFDALPFHAPGYENGEQVLAAARRGAAAVGDGASEDLRKDRPLANLVSDWCMTIKSFRDACDAERIVRLTPFEGIFAAEAWQGILATRNVTEPGHSETAVEMAMESWRNYVRAAAISPGVGSQCLREHLATWLGWRKPSATSLWPNGDLPGVPVWMEELHRQGQADMLPALYGLASAIVALADGIPVAHAIASDSQNSTSPIFLLPQMVRLVPKAHVWHVEIAAKISHLLPSPQEPQSANSQRDSDGKTVLFTAWKHTGLCLPDIRLSPSQLHSLGEKAIDTLVGGNGKEARPVLEGLWNLLVHGGNRAVQEDGIPLRIYDESVFRLYLSTQNIPPEIEIDEIRLFVECAPAPGSDAVASRDVKTPPLPHLRIRSGNWLFAATCMDSNGKSTWIRRLGNEKWENDSLDTILAEHWRSCRAVAEWIANWQPQVDPNMARDELLESAKEALENGTLRSDGAIVGRLANQLSNWFLSVSLDGSVYVESLAGLPRVGSAPRPLRVLRSELRRPTSEGTAKRLSAALPSATASGGRDGFFRLRMPLPGKRGSLDWGHVKLNGGSLELATMHKEVQERLQANSPTPHLDRLGDYLAEVVRDEFQRVAAICGELADAKMVVEIEFVSDTTAAKDYLLAEIRLAVPAHGLRNILLLPVYPASEPIEVENVRRFCRDTLQQSALGALALLSAPAASSVVDAVPEALESLIRKRLFGGWHAVSITMGRASGATHSFDALISLPGAIDDLAVQGTVSVDGETVNVDSTALRKQLGKMLARYYADINDGEELKVEAFSVGLVPSLFRFRIAAGGQMIDTTLDLADLRGSIPALLGGIWALASNATAPVHLLVMEDILDYVFAGLGLTFDNLETARTTDGVPYCQFDLFVPYPSADQPLRIPDMSIAFHPHLSFNWEPPAEIDASWLKQLSTTLPDAARVRNAEMRLADGRLHIRFDISRSGSEEPASVVPILLVVDSQGAEVTCPTGHVKVADFNRSLQKLVDDMESSLKDQLERLFGQCVQNVKYRSGRIDFDLVLALSLPGGGANASPPPELKLTGCMLGFPSKAPAEWRKDHVTINRKSGLAFQLGQLDNEKWREIENCLRKQVQTIFNGVGMTQVDFRFMTPRLSGDQVAVPIVVGNENKTEIILPIRVASNGLRLDLDGLRTALLGYHVGRITGRTIADQMNAINCRIQPFEVKVPEGKLASGKGSVTLTLVHKPSESELADMLVLDVDKQGSPRFRLRANADENKLKDFIKDIVLHTLGDEHKNIVELLERINVCRHGNDGLKITCLLPIPVGESFAVDIPVGLTVTPDGVQFDFSGGISLVQFVVAAAKTQGLVGTTIQLGTDFSVRIADITAEPKNSIRMDFNFSFQQSMMPIKGHIVIDLNDLTKFPKPEFSFDPTALLASGVLNQLQNMIPFPAGMEITDLNIDDLPSSISFGFQMSVKIGDADVKIKADGIVLDRRRGIRGPSSIGAVVPGQIFIPPVALSEIGGTLGKKGIELKATLTPVEENAKYLIKCPGRFWYDFDRPLQMRTSTDLVLLSVLRAGRSESVISFADVRYQTSAKIGGMIKRILFFDGSLMIKGSGGAATQAHGDLKLVGQKVGRGVLSMDLGRRELLASGHLKLLDRQIDATARIPRDTSKTTVSGRGNLRLGKFNLSGFDIAINSHQASATWTTLGIPFSLVLPSFADINNPGRIIRMIAEALDPTNKSWDKMFDSFMTMEFSFNPLSDFGSGSSRTANQGGSDGGSKNPNSGGNGGADGREYSTRSSTPTEKSPVHTSGRSTKLALNAPGKVSVVYKEDEGVLYLFADNEKKVRLQMDVDQETLFIRQGGRIQLRNGLFYWWQNDSLVLIEIDGCTVKVFRFSGVTENNLAKFTATFSGIAIPKNPSTLRTGNWGKLLSLNQPNEISISAIKGTSAGDAKGDVWKVSGLADGQNFQLWLPYADTLLPSSYTVVVSEECDVEGAIAYAAVQMIERHKPTDSTIRCFTYDNEKFLLARSFHNHTAPAATACIHACLLGTNGNNDHFTLPEANVNRIHNLCMLNGDVSKDIRDMINMLDGNMGLKDVLTFLAQQGNEAPRFLAWNKDGALICDFVLWRQEGGKKWASARIHPHSPSHNGSWIRLDQDDLRKEWNVAWSLLGVGNPPDFANEISKESADANFPVAPATLMWGILNSHKVQTP